MKKASCHKGFKGVQLKKLIKLIILAFLNIQYIYLSECNGYIHCQIENLSMQASNIWSSHLTNTENGKIFPNRAFSTMNARLFWFKIYYPKLTRQCIQFQWFEECNLLLFIIQKHRLDKINCSHFTFKICLLVSKIRLCVVYHSSRAQHSAYVGEKSLAN